MSPLAWFLAVATAGAAGADWWAVARDRSRLRPVTKPAALVALLGVALAIDPFDPAVRAWMVAGLVLSLIGDVALLRPERWFIAGLVAFLFAHVAYIVGLQRAHESMAVLLVGLAVVVGGGLTVGRRIVGAVASGSHGKLRGPVVVYLVVISGMVVSAFGTAAPLAIAGALLFFGSDAILAWNRFVAPLRRGPLAVMVTYHLGQAGLVGWAIAG